MSPHRPLGRRRAGVGSLVTLALLVAAAPTFADAIVVPEAPMTVDGSPYRGPWEHFGSTSGRSALSTDAATARISRAYGESVSLSKTTDFDPAPESMRFSFDIDVSGIGSRAAGTQVFRVGAGFGFGNVDELDARTYARLGLSATATGFQLRDLVTGRTSATFTGTQAITWALNHSAGTLTYDAPNGTTESLASDHMDVWVGREKVFDDIVVTSRDVPMSELKWFWSGAGGGTTTFHNASVSALDGLTTLQDAGLPSTAPAATVTLEGAVADPTLQLYRPAPNPFQRTTQFAYAVADGAQHVDIGVFDIAGRRVRLLVNGLQSAGRYSVTWDGVADDGARAVNGVYFLRAAIGGTSRTARVVYLVQP